MDGFWALLAALLLLINPGNGHNHSHRRSSPPPPSQNLPVGRGPTPAVPSPALLPGAIAFGAALLKKKRQEAEI
jgi:hypothetical protein